MRPALLRHGKINLSSIKFRELGETGTESAPEAKLSDWLSNLGPWLKAHPDLILPLLLSLGMAGCDLKTRRIPNYLTLGGALGGLGFQLGYHGLPGLLEIGRAHV